MANEKKKFLVKMTQSAEKDLTEIIMVVFQNNPKTAAEVLKRIQKKINALDTSPTKGRYVPELFSRHIKDYRQIIEGSWKIIYRIDDNVVSVLAITVSRRNLHDLLEETLSSSGLF